MLEKYFFEELKQALSFCTILTLGGENMEKNIKNCRGAALLTL
jgi:hypothetical protein